MSNRVTPNISHLGDDPRSRRRLEVDAWWSVVRAYLECSRRYGQMLAQLDLTVTQFDALEAIAALDGEAMPKAIAEKLVVSRANVTGVIQRLVEHRLVRTDSHASDARSIVCTLTAEGESRLSAARGAAARFVTAQLAPFTSDDLQAVETMMRDMHRHLKTLDPVSLAHAEDPATPIAESR